MRNDISTTVFRHEYVPYPYRLPNVELQFELEPEQTTVVARLVLEACAQANAPVVLYGQDLNLVSLAIDGRPLAAKEFLLDSDALTVFPTTPRFTLDIVSTC